MQVKSKNKGLGIFGQIRKYTRILVFCANIVCLFLLFLSTKAWDITPSSFAVVAYLGLGFPILVALNILFLILWCITWKWKFIVVNLLVFVLLWVPISSYYPLHLQTSRVPEDCIKVLSYNVKGLNFLSGDAARSNPIFDYIKEYEADIVCLQEFIVANEKHKNGIISLTEFNQVMKDYPYRSVVRMGNTNSKHIYGIACYSKFPITKTTRLPFPKSTYNGSAIHELKIKGRTVTLLNNHLESNRITAEDKKLYYQLFDQKDGETLDKVANNIRTRMGLAFRKREVQAHIIQSYLAKQKTEATIVCGDFNDTAMSYTYKAVKGDLIDSYAQTGCGVGATFNENLFLFRIDFIFHSDNMEAFNTTVGDKKLSDHYPVASYLRFK